MLTRESVLFIRYLIQTNLRLYTTVWISLFIVFPFFIAIIGVTDSALQIYIVTLFFGWMLVCVIPIYLWQFLYKKRSADLYYSLPIKRTHMFYIIFFTGYILALFPVSLNILLVCFVVPDRFGTITYVILSMFVIYALVTWVVQQCNNLLDGIVVSVCYIVVPLILVGALSVFIDNQYSNFMIGSSTYSAEIPFYNVIPMGISMLYGLFALYATFIRNEVNMLLALYWLGVSVLCMHFANKSFAKRKQEDSEQQTTVWWAYPSIISVVIFSLILININASQNTVFLSICTFILYLCMIFFSKRKIKITRYNIVLFVGIYVGCSGLSFIFTQAKGFNIVQEIPNIANIKGATILFNDQYLSNVRTDSLLNIEYQVADGSKKELTVTKLQGKSQNQRDIEAIVTQQEVLIKEYLKRGSNQSYQNLYNFTIVYNLKNGKEITRTYNTEKEDAKAVLTTLLTENAKKETSIKIEYKQTFE